MAAPVNGKVSSGSVRIEAEFTNTLASCLRLVFSQRRKTSLLAISPTQLLSRSTKQGEKGRSTTFSVLFPFVLLHSFAPTRSRSLENSSALLQSDHTQLFASLSLFRSHLPNHSFPLKKETFPLLLLLLPSQKGFLAVFLWHTDRSMKFFLFPQNFEFYLANFCVPTSTWIFIGINSPESRRTLTSKSFVGTGKTQKHWKTIFSFSKTAAKLERERFSG